VKVTLWPDRCSRPRLDPEPVLRVIAESPSRRTPGPWSSRCSEAHPAARAVTGEAGADKQGLDARVSLNDIAAKLTSQLVMQRLFMASAFLGYFRVPRRPGRANRP